MTKSEAMRITRQQNVLMQLGFTMHEADSLRRISMTLRSWHEKECGNGDGCIERDEVTGKAYWYRANHSYLHANDPRARYQIRDMETGAKNRLAKIIAERNKREFHKIVPTALDSYIQGDPRGAALYIIRPGDIPAGQNADSCYSRGIVVY